MIKWIITGIVAAFLLIASVISVDLTYIDGNQLGVKETWKNGVEDNVVFPGMKILIPGWNQKIYRYSMSPNIFVMNDRTNDERANGRPTDAYVAKSADNQEMTMWLALQWRYDPDNIVKIQKTYRTHVGVRDWDNIIEEKLIRQVLIKIVNTEATKHTAIDAYSGSGFIQLQNDIASELLSPDGELRQKGIIVDNFTIEQIRLAPDYIGEINKRQVAQQRTLRAQEEEKAALAEAKKAEAEARADYNRQVVEAEREKQKAILASEGSAQQKINDATAQAEQVRLAAQAERDAAMLKAEAIKAIGQAEADAQKLKLSAYSVEGAESFVQIEVSKQLAQAFQNIDGYLPGDMGINLLTGSFLDSVRSLMGNGTPMVVNTPTAP